MPVRENYVPVSWFSHCWYTGRTNTGRLKRRFRTRRWSWRLQSRSLSLGRLSRVARLASASDTSVSKNIEVVWRNIFLLPTDGRDYHLQTIQDRQTACSTEHYMHFQQNNMYSVIRVSFSQISFSIEYQQHYTDSLSLLAASQSIQLIVISLSRISWSPPIFESAEIMTLMSGIAMCRFDCYTQDLFKQDPKGMTCCASAIAVFASQHRSSRLCLRAAC